MNDINRIAVNSLFKITYGMYIVSSKFNNKLNGYISNTVMQVTSDPVQLAICCSKNNYSSEIIKKSKILSISVLQRETSPDLINLFGYNTGKDINKFENIKYINGFSGVPIVIQDSIVWFECELINIIESGSHNIFICKVIKSETLDFKKEPLTYAYYRDIKKGVAPKNAPTFIDTGKLKTESVYTLSAIKYKCQVCNFIYNPDEGDDKAGIPPGTEFQDLPDDWVCPVCGTKKSNFLKL
jgi:flavin reductase (DIM6/NTAB) family NADH-FMN oxidoreductase RutF/rubredoxin